MVKFDAQGNHMSMSGKYAACASASDMPKDSGELVDMYYGSDSTYVDYQWVKASTFGCGGEQTMIDFGSVEFAKGDGYCTFDGRRRALGKCVWVY